MAQMQHPERLAWAEALPPGYGLDGLGQIRHLATRELVCGWSGRGHTEYLLPMPWLDPAVGEVRMVWVDRDTTEMLRRSVSREAARRARGGLGDIVRSLFAEVLRFLGNRARR